MGDPAIRPYRASDRDALVRICLRTGDAGGDATGKFRHDGMLADVFALPYAERDPELAFVVDDGAGEAVGYVLATDDTTAFDAWFRDSWWPAAAGAYADARSVSPDAEMLASADRIGREPVPYADEYPAHLHIDLLPQTQGGGWGRRLIATQLDALRARGVPGVHLVAAAENTGAAAFYTRLGFTPLPSDPGAAAFGMRLR